LRCNKDAEYLINDEPFCALHAIKYAIWRAHEAYMEYNRLYEGVSRALREPTETHLFAMLDYLLSVLAPMQPVFDVTTRAAENRITNLEMPREYRGGPIDDLRFPPGGVNPSDVDRDFESWAERRGDEVKNDV